MSMMRRAIFAVAALALTPVSVAAQNASDAEIAKLANQICREMEISRNLVNSPVHRMFRDLILRHLAIDANSPQWETKMVAFWNANHEQMVCMEPISGYPNPQPLLKRVVAMGTTTSFFGDFFFRHEGLNVNAVEQTERGPETLLDYLYWLQTTPDFELLYGEGEQIAFLIEYLEEVMNGKRAAELAK